MLIQSVRISTIGLVAVAAIGTIVLAQQGNTGSPASINAAAKSAGRKPLNSDPQSCAARSAGCRARKPREFLREKEVAQRAEQKNAIIRQKLDMPIGADFPQSSLEVLLKQIKKGDDGRLLPGIPIYVDPLGLSEAIRP